MTPACAAVSSRPKTGAAAGSWVPASAPLRFAVKTTLHLWGRPGGIVVFRMVVLLAAVVLSAGCANKGNDSLAGATRGGGGSGGMGIPFTPFRLPGGGGSQHASAPALTPEEVRSQVMSLGDSYIQTIVQSYDALIATTKDPAKANWARKQRVATISVSITNSTGPNAIVSLLDMVVFATLKREAVENHWVPTLLGEEGSGIAAAHRRGEDEAWAAAARVFSKPHLQQLRELIDEWRRKNPEQYYVGYTRFSDFDAYRNLTPESPEAKAPGSLFSMFYVDPLAGLDPVTKELRNYRLLTERLAYTVSRMPILMAYQIDLAVSNSIESPEIRKFVDSTDRFAGATGRFADAVVKYPKDLSVEREAAVKQLGELTARERQAAIEQASRTIATEREKIFKEIEAQDGRIRGILGDVTKLVERAELAGANLSKATAETITTTENATQRTLDQAFRLTLILVGVVLVGVPVVVLAYRATNRRFSGPPPTVGFAGKS